MLRSHASAFFVLGAVTPWRAAALGAGCVADRSVEFPQSTVHPVKSPKTHEQKWMDEHWPGYKNGVSLGGLFVMENWMFFHRSGPFDKATLHLEFDAPFDNLRWSQELLAGGDVERAYATMDCHLKEFYSDAALDQFAEYGINSIRLPVAYWLFDSISLYPTDIWQYPPSGKGKYGAYGVNPDGFITPGVGVLTDLVVKLWNRNIEVLLDMHALPGCSSPHQSYAGVWCEPGGSNTWHGEAKDGISGGHRGRRSDDGKTWTDVARRIALERVVPWIKFVNGIAPGAIVGYELVNEPDIAQSDASADQVRGLTVDLGAEVLECLGDLGDSVFIGISTASKNMPASKVAKDYKTKYTQYKTKFVSDIHHYFNWAGCIDYNKKTFSVECACESNLPGSPREFEDAEWAGWMRGEVLDQGWRFYVGEWSAAMLTAHPCQNGGPTVDQARSTWTAQKWGYMNQWMSYGMKAAGDASSFYGDYYWNGRMGYNWNPDPAVCAGPSSPTHFEGFKYWDWSLLRLIDLGIARPLSEMGWTPASMASKKAETCTGIIPVLCQQERVEHIQSGGQPGMDRLFEDSRPETSARVPVASGVAVVGVALAVGMLVSVLISNRHRQHPSPDESAVSLVSALSLGQQDARMMEGGA